MVFKLGTRRLSDFLTLLVHGVAFFPSSEWNPVRLSKQWPEFFEGGLVLTYDIGSGRRIINI